MIGKKDLENFADLARIELPQADEEEVLRNLAEILDFFKELQVLPTDRVEPMVGGTFETNVTRSDTTLETAIPDSVPTESFPESRNGFLKVPPVFPAEGGSASGGE